MTPDLALVHLREAEAVILDIAPQIARDATLSDDGLFRYTLTRVWDDRLPSAVFVMLNPSTADARIDDPTIRRCVGFARSWGLGGITVVNLFAWRATDPRDLAARRNAGHDVVGPDNDQATTTAAVAAARAGAPLVAAWGAHATPARAAEVMRLPGMDRASCLGVTKFGAPRHPLYLRSDATLQPFGRAS